MTDVNARLAALETRVTELEDLNAIRRLQWAYGYYIDYNRPEEVAGLVRFLRVGDQGIRLDYAEIGRFRSSQQ